MEYLKDVDISLNNLHISKINLLSLATFNTDFVLVVEAPFLSVGQGALVLILILYTSLSIYT